MSLHDEVLARPQRGALALLGPSMGAEECYLGGGTAIALQLGHRRSVDLDWFTARALGDLSLFAVRLQAQGIPFTIDRIAPGTLHGRVRSVPVSLLEYRYPLLEQLVPWPTDSWQLASLDDLAAMKLSAIAQRGAKKDFMDLYALASTHRPLRQLVDGYRRKYRTEDIGHVLYALSYFEDADRDRSPTMLWDVQWRTVKGAIREWVMELAR